MIKIVKAIAYVLTAILILSLIGAGIMLVLGIMTFGGTIVLTIGAIVIVALLVKECVESIFKR